MIVLTCNELHHGQRLQDSMEIRVRKQNTNPSPPRDVELYATGPEGAELQVILWEKHNQSKDYNIGRTYLITGGRVKRYKDATGPEVRVHSNDEFLMKPVKRSSDSIEVLVVSDTHVGYPNRMSTAKPNWARSPSARNRFREAIDIAKANAVDAILHAGDIFDHKAAEDDCRWVARNLFTSLESEIPFYYIRGNHDTDQGIEHLEEVAEATQMQLRLGNHPATLKNPRVNIFGLDYTAKEFPSEDPIPAASEVAGQNILVLHKKLHPIVNDQGDDIYKSGADITGLLDSIAGSIDLVVAGHMHVGTEGRISEHDVPVIMVGPTIRISKQTKDNQPSVWLVTLSQNDLRIERIEFQ